MSQQQQQLLVIKPSTAVVIKFVDNKQVTLHADIVCRIFPKHVDAIKSLAVAVDPKDGCARALLDMSGTDAKYAALTMEQAMKIASHVCGGRWDPTVRYLLHAFANPMSCPATTDGEGRARVGIAADKPRTNQCRPCIAI